MGYNLGIGEFEVDICHDERRAHCSVEGQCLDTAPINSSDTQGNFIYPSYTTWANFAQSVGLYSLFYAPRSIDDQGRETTTTEWWKDKKGEEFEGLLSQHPGTFPLTESHLIAFKEAKKKYLELPEPRPGLYDGPVENRMKSEKGVDYNLRRLDWLIFWTEWALKNCEHPTFSNS